ncbi:MAG: ABC transporter permease subunit [bacterium]|nr:ABC transporter permease subunit [bacterium]
MSLPNLLAQSESPGIADNEVLDQWTIPFGEWVKQMVNWIDLNLGWLLDIIEWPFTFLFRNFVDSPDHHPWWEITDMPWIAVCLIFFVIGTLARNVKVGGFVALALAGCGLLGIEYWDDTALTVGMIIVAVALCALIGIPLGVLCGRFDGVWNAVRPVLDAMQVVHAFVYMLPVIFFFGIGTEPATMVTMVFALPPLIRLTNLGVRQVPADVVEASRAYGAPEWRVLLDVQLPLARPAIMTGLNQTLLLSISMLGIAAIMGAGGLGLQVFRAVQALDVALAASSGLALFMVAVVLDRISQTEESDGQNLFTRIRRAWAHRRDPEALLPQASSIGVVAKTRSHPAPLSAAERRFLAIVAAGALVAVVAVFLPWGSDSGRISGYSRLVDTGRYEYVGISSGGAAGYVELQEASIDPPAEHAQEIAVLEAQLHAVIVAAGAEGVTDEETLTVIADIGDEIALLSNPLAGRSFRGLDATGGSFYGIMVLGFALLILAAIVANLRRPGGDIRLFGSNGVVVLAIGSLAAAIAYIWAPASSANVTHSMGVGPWVAVVGGVVATLGALAWLREAPYAARTPLRAGVSYRQISVVALVAALIVISGFSGWSFDQRVESVVSPELLAQVSALEQQAENTDDPAVEARIAQEIIALYSEAQRTEKIVIDGFAGDGSKYGYLAIALGIVGIACVLPAAGAFGSNERRRRRWNAVVAGVGVSLMVVASAWIASLLRVADLKFASGAGAFICLVAGFLLMASTVGVLTKFSRSQVYVSVDEPESIPEGATVSVE